MASGLGMSDKKMAGTVVDNMVVTDGQWMVGEEPYSGGLRNDGEWGEKNDPSPFENRAYKGKR